MGIFRNINQNLYELWFRENCGLNNHYDYIKLVYGWRKEAVEAFESGTFHKHKVAYAWMNKSIPEAYFNYGFQDNLLGKETAYAACYKHLKDHVHLPEEDASLKLCLEQLIFRSEDLSVSFVWPEDIQKQLTELYYMNSACKVLTTLLVLAQTKKLTRPPKKYNVHSQYTHARLYEKKIFSENMEIFFEDCYEVNMAQISCPSLIESYHDFFKKASKISLLEALHQNPKMKLNLLFIDPDYSVSECLTGAYMYGDFFSQGTGVIQDSIQFARELKAQFPTQVTAKKIPVPFAYSILQAKKLDGESLLKLDIYSPINSADSRFSLVFSNTENKDAYDFYAANFYEMFNSHLAVEL